MGNWVNSAISFHVLIEMVAFQCPCDCAIKVILLRALTNTNNLFTFDPFKATIIIAEHLFKKKSGLLFHLYPLSLLK